MESKENKTRTITLTDRPPVRIRDADWPQLASASGDSFHGNDYARHRQARAQHEVDEYTLIVRQHNDDRCLVYAILDAATVWTGTESRRGGELLTPGENLIAAIKRVGEDVGLPESIIRDCIADLPAEEI